MTTKPRPLSFPSLPPHGPDSVNIQQAHQLISEAYSRANQVLREEDGDPPRLRLHSERLQTRTVPILRALEAELQDERWVADGAQLLADLIIELETAATNASNVQHGKITFYDPVSVIRTGRRGRPRKVIDDAFLQDAMSPTRRITRKRLSQTMRMHRNTLRTRLKECGLQSRFTPISDEDLDRLVTVFKLVRPDSGLRYTMGFLHHHKIKVQKERVRDALRRCDGLGQAIRNHAAIDRREYKVPRPNYLWHTDGHHKLIRYGIVIHGFVDGYDRMIIAMKPSTNNLASTVLSLFKEGVYEQGTAPSRVRGDRGGENIEVSVWMIQHRGPNRASFMWGSSTRNTRIERMWVEVGSQFARRWRVFFGRLEDLHHLDPNDPVHLWLLHKLFLEEINQDCENFRQDWNHHPISRKANDQSPADMRLLGQLEHGIYVDDYEDVHPDILNRYYGVDSETEQLTGQTGAGHPLDEDGAAPSLQDNIAADQEGHIRHDPIEVPDHESPFASTEVEDIFLAAMANVRNQGIVPDGYGVAQAEWDEGEYPEVELLKCGRAGKYIQVTLPFAIWWPRAVAWAQGLDVLNRMQTMFEA